MASYSIAPEACKVPRDLGHISTNLELQSSGVQIRGGERTCLTQIGNRYPNVRPVHLHNVRTNRKRWWITHAAEAQALADADEVPIESLLCSGCRKLLARLQRSGDWP